MSKVHRAFPPFASALRETLREGYGRADLLRDFWAGISVGIIAVPLSLALAIASGVPPQHGLYTAVVAGAVVALAGGSRFNVTGPTAAFVVILYPIAGQHGIGGLLLATLMAGLILVALGWGRLGQLIAYIPHSVTTGFTSGIAVVIASLQVRDFLGLQFTSDAEHFLGRVGQIAQALPTLHVSELALGVATLLLMIAWRRWKLAGPPYLAGAIFCGTVAWALKTWWPDVAVTTVADRFGGIAATLPSPSWPWALPGKDGAPLQISFELLRSLAGPAFAIAMLGAIESLLCAVIADGMTGKKHDPNAELVAQGLGNIAAPIFGGIPCTGALARTAANIRAGARSPIASFMHAMFVLAAMLALAPLLGWLPMCGLAALLLKVAWNMSERKNFIRIVRVAPRSDVLLLLACFALTVLVDMVTAIVAGVVLGSILFMHRMSKLSSVNLLEASHPEAPAGLPRDVRFYEIAGPLFFGAAERAMESLRVHDKQVRAVVLDLSSVPTIDITGLIALEGAIDDLNEAGITVALCGAQASVLEVLREAGYVTETPKRWYCESSAAAIRRLQASPENS
jgi:SulP family sulfate permease